MKKILFQSDFSLIKSGFGKNARTILSYLYKTGKYEIVHYAVGVEENCQDLAKTPWKSLGCVPSSKEKQAQIAQDPRIKNLVSYGSYYIDDIIKKEKPDVYLAVQDIWGVEFAIGKPWFNKVNSVVWTTLDSLPILPMAIAAAKKSKNYWVWSDFATKALHKLGQNHVKTMHGALDDKFFFKLKDEDRQKLRDDNGISKDCFIIGFVFRNQLRKSVPNLLNGFKKFKEANPDLDTKLLLHTSFNEGWNIYQFCEEVGLNKTDILTTHVCSACANYEVKTYIGPNKECKFCGSKESLNTTGVGFGVDEPSLNEVYNLMDVYCHPFTSGGQEIPIQEAKLTELVTLVTNYSCGEEMCYPEAHSLPLEWSEYRELGSQFIKASTHPESIYKQIDKVFRMSTEERSDIGKKARRWVVENFSINVVGKAIEDFIDSCLKVEDSVFDSIQQKDPFAKVLLCNDDIEWVKTLYRNILKIEVSDSDEGLIHWINKIKNGAPKTQIENYFRNAANNDNVGNKNDRYSFLSKKSNEKRVLYFLPDEAVDAYLTTSFFKSIKKKYKDHLLSVCCSRDNKIVLAFNPFVDEVIEKERIDLSDFFAENKDKKYFDIIFSPQHANGLVLNFEDYE